MRVYKYPCSKVKILHAQFFFWLSNHIMKKNVRNVTYAPILTEIFKIFAKTLPWSIVGSYQGFDNILPLRTVHHAGFELLCILQSGVVEQHFDEGHLGSSSACSTINRLP